MKEFFYSVQAKDITHPAWSEKVERWYQLDEASKTLCQMAYEWQTQTGLDFSKAQAVVYIFSRGSNTADQAFVDGGLISPSQFVYTLPNVPISMAQQLLGLAKATYCFDFPDVFDLNPVQNLLKVFKNRQQHVMVIGQQKNEQTQCWDFKGFWL